MTLGDDGKVALLDGDGTPLPPKLVKAVREQQGEALSDWLQEQCAEWNQGIERILGVHLETPAIGSRREHKPKPFPEPQPVPPLRKKLGVLGRVLPPVRRKIEATNDQATRDFEELHEEWRKREIAHNAEQEEITLSYERAHRGDPQAIADVFARTISELDWPRETIVAFDVHGETLLLDVDLPEVEDMPTKQATVAARGLKLNIRDRSQTQIRREYMQHVHGIAFRLVGEAFAVLPDLDDVVVSGFSQRPDKATGQVIDEYLLSARVSREAWKEISFDNLDQIDLPTCFERFELTRRMTKTGVFTAIDPLGDA